MYNEKIPPQKHWNSAASKFSDSSPTRRTGKSVKNNCCNHLNGFYFLFPKSKRLVFFFWRKGSFCYVHIRNIRYTVRRESRRLNNSVGLIIN